jgi:hypothetical protein
MSSWIARTLVLGHQIGRIEPLSRSERSGGKIVPRYKQKGPFELDRQRRNVAWIANAWHGAARRTAHRFAPCPDKLDHSTKPPTVVMVMVMATFTNFG